MIRKLTPQENEYISQNQSFEPYEDIAQQMTMRVWGYLLNSGYDEHELENVGNGKDTIQIANVDNRIIIYYFDEVIYEAPSNILIHKFIQAGEEAILNWFIEKIGRELEPIDSDFLFQDLPESKTVLRLTESQFKTLIAESVKEVLKEYGQGVLPQRQLGRLARRYNEKGDTRRAEEISNYALDKSYDALLSQRKKNDSVFEPEYRQTMRNASFKYGLNGNRGTVKNVLKGMKSRFDNGLEPNYLDI